MRIGKLEMWECTNAVTEAALGFDSRYRAKYRLGRIYQSQGDSSKDIFLRYYDEAMVFRSELYQSLLDIIPILL